ncbi:hypothetical protein [Nitrosomonas ureae]|uniref:Uncharacterized protein n=1 Tax=Nitrosomonas ureae TaxID=44577 RepID=A0A2T5IDM9_9PROT|nr:hypothetical protein [Nitrosomonas ureae]PTQ81935.1 hypothetical protein C8R28_10291 [Nitrosomonas ureae]
MKQFINLVMVLFLLVPVISNAGEDGNGTKATINKDAAIAGGAAAGVTVVGVGAVAATASAATLTSTIAIVGAGSMAVGIGVIAAVPIIVGGSVYAAYSWFTSDKDKKD